MRSTYLGSSCVCVCVCVRAGVCVSVHVWHMYVCTWVRGE